MAGQPGLCEETMGSADRCFCFATALSMGSSFLLTGESVLRFANHAVLWFRQLLVAGSNGAATDLAPSCSMDVERTRPMWSVNESVNKS
jgi:hypothetical protein